jgi:Protein of unknown function (DUF551)
MTASKWQPIKTAPKDGTWIMLCGGSIEDGWDDGDAKPPVVVGQFVAQTNNHEREGYYQFAWYDSGYYGEYESPTHWMPLPKVKA